MQVMRRAAVLRSVVFVLVLLVTQGADDNDEQEGAEQRDKAKGDRRDSCNSPSHENNVSAYVAAMLKRQELARNAEVQAQSRGHRVRRPVDLYIYIYIYIYI